MNSILKDYSFFSTNLLDSIIPEKYKLMPNVVDIFELEFALGELSLLTDEDLIQRSGFISEVDGKKTNHYHIGLASSLDVYNGKSIRTRSFFTKGRFSTGYSVHSLFPYRGKFHAQLIKGIINIIGIKPGDTILDPMMGSGTACIEAQLMGINSYGFDISPFCVLMASAKSKALSSDSKIFQNAHTNLTKTVEYIQSNRNSLLNEIFINDERGMVILAYLDAMGYARRVTGKEAIDKFPEVLRRYENTVSTFSELRNRLDLSFGKNKYHIGNAKSLPLQDNSIDGIITSPPYSFAIDYVENDLPQLEFLGVDVNELKNQLVGLRGGRKKADRIQVYLEDLDLIIKEMGRVLKPGKSCVIIIGSNEIQTGGIRFEANVKQFAIKHNMVLDKEMIKPIRGIQNSMADEYILFFRKAV